MSLMEELNGLFRANPFPKPLSDGHPGADAGSSTGRALYL
jgi:hypothetical protein